jgi:hypothetical protein
MLHIDSLSVLSCFVIFVAGLALLFCIGISNTEMELDAWLACRHGVAT